MAGVAREHPPRTGRVAEETLPAHHAQELVHAPRALESARDRCAPRRVFHEARLEVTAKLSQIHARDEYLNLVEPAVGWAADHEPAVPLVEDERGLAETCALEVAPV